MALYRNLTTSPHRFLRARALWVFLSLALLPLLTLGVYSRMVVEGGVLRVQVWNLRSHAEELARTLDDYLTERGRDVTLMARHPLIRSFSAAPPQERSALRAQVLTDLANFLQINSYYQCAFLLDTSGRLLLSTAEDADPQAASRPYFLRAMAGETTISETSLLSDPDRAVIYFSPPVPHPEGKGIVGVAVLRVRARELWERVERETDHAGKGSLAVLFDEYGIRLWPIPHPGSWSFGP